MSVKQFVTRMNQLNFCYILENSLKSISSSLVISIGELIDVINNRGEFLIFTDSNFDLDFYSSMLLVSL